MCITNNVPLQEDNAEEIDNLEMLEHQAILYNVNRKTDLTLGSQQRDKIVRYLFHRNN